MIHVAGGGITTREFYDDLEPFERRQHEVIQPQPPDFQIFLEKIIQKIFIGKPWFSCEKRF